MSVVSLQELRDRAVDQLDYLLARHGHARSAGSGYTGMPADIASLAEAVATLDRRLDEKRGKR